MPLLRGKGKWHYVKKLRLPSVAICHETLAKVPKPAVLYKRIASGAYQQVVVSPKTATLVESQAAVLKKPWFYQHLCIVCIDEPDYARLGMLRASIPRNVPFVIAFATLLGHILDDIYIKLLLFVITHIILLINARPNVVLLSKADLQFLILAEIRQVSDISITLMYCNTHITYEDIVHKLRRWLQAMDIEVITFYHAKTSDNCKCELKDKLRTGKVCIPIYTDAVGIGWMLPSFCALVQRAGRIAHNLNWLGEAILIVPVKLLKKDIIKEDIATAIEAACSEASFMQPEPPPMQVMDEDMLEIDGAVVAEENQIILVHEGDFVICGTRKKCSTMQCNLYEAQFLSKFVYTQQCRRCVWNEFLKNFKKVDRHVKKSRKTSLKIHIS
ncbi:hypothetical protein OBBRIDRAFT_815648 [Obba rivulosa]|uniref:Uncharacterized protein n=1 Tax=Obba rivulosa TaxID=1052685 RepID=A0A8E2AKG6_9APHY|nr:hypothetical protein OBBRIDRAFT_815648 [Obba rivulosa]